VRRWDLPVLFSVLGLLFLALLPLILKTQRSFYAQNEPFFSSPVTTTPLALRNDSYGKGAFGASRNGGRAHKGIDLLAEMGTPIFSAKSGRIVSALFDEGYGNFIEILHPDGLSTRYAHLAYLNVKQGAWVSQGQAVGYSGKSGNAANPRIKPHLHFEIRQGQRVLNPLTLLDPSLSVN